MNRWEPPRGQNCGNCRHCGASERPGATDEDACWAFGEYCTLPRKNWCAYWTGDKTVRCGRCAHYQSPTCPRMLVILPRPGNVTPDPIPPSHLAVPSKEAFSCERFEEAEQEGKDKP